MGKRKLYMVVTADKFELPLCVGNIEEIASYCNMTINGAYKALDTNKSGERNGKCSKRRIVDIGIRE